MNVQQRKTELEAKKRNLEKLRVERATKKKDQQQNPRRSMEEAGTMTMDEPQLQGPPPINKENLEAVVANLLGPTAISGVSAAGGLTEDELRERDRKKRAAKLAALASQHNVVNVNIPSREVLTYDKACQTVGLEQSPVVTLQAASSAHFRDSQNFDEYSSVGVGGGSVKEHSAKELAVQTEDANQNQRIVGHKMPEEDKGKVFENPTFRSFFNRASKIAERALSVKQRSETKANKPQDSQRGAAQFLSLECSFYDEGLCTGRAVHDVTYPKKHPELVVVAYSNRINLPVEAGQEGLVIVWNIVTPHTPEMVLYCGSDVLRAFVSHFNQNLIVGSTYNGQIVVWDKSQMVDGVMFAPSSRTPLSPFSHTLPVFCMDLVGSDNAHSLITISTDGKMRAWNLTHLDEPQEGRHDLTYPTEPKDDGAKEPLAVTCMAFVEGDVTSCVVGGEDGQIFSISRNTGQSEDVFKYHDAPVSGVHIHPPPNATSGQTDYSYLILSSSFDWTVALWDKSRPNDPLFVFEEANDFVYDVKWSPTHPGVFATGDGAGQLCVWNLAAELDTPVDRVEMDRGAGINRIRWSGDGRRLAAGTAHGEVFVYNVHNDLVSNPEDAKRFAHRITELQQTTGVHEELEA
eukprot:c3070_g1_i1.p1 GENE.c3070_g1_i1~~c3070_g1_i1.p1  ORF type:complete len:631 (+),score=161.88 c3070_g1_i1:68-1960(+)